VRIVLLFNPIHTAYNNMVVTRSQRPKSGSPTATTPAESAPAEASPAKSKKPQKSKAKLEKKTTTAATKKPAKVQKKKTPKRIGPKPPPKEPSKTSHQAASKPPSKPASDPSLEAIAKAALEKFSNSNALFTPPDDFTPELLEELGLAYVDLPSFNGPASADATQAKPKPVPRHTYLERGRFGTGSRTTPDGKTLPKGFWTHPWFFREHWDEGPPFGALDTDTRVKKSPVASPRAAESGESPRDGPSVGKKTSRPSKNEPTRDMLNYPPSAPHPVSWASPITPSFGAQRSSTPKSSPVVRGFSNAPSPLSPRGVKAGKALLNAVESTSPSPFDDFSFGSLEFELGAQVNDLLRGSYNDNATFKYLLRDSYNDDGTFKGSVKGPKPVVRDTSKQVEEQPTSTRHPSTDLFGNPKGSLFHHPPPGTLFDTPTGTLFGKPPASALGPQPNEVVRDGDDEEEDPESPVSVNNAQVFKRPTVVDLRRERALLHGELDGWVGRLELVRDEFDGIISEVEDRMLVLKAVNRMQAPLRKAPLGRGRGHGRYR